MASLDGMITCCADTLWKAPDRTGDREMYVHHYVMESGGWPLLIYLSKILKFLTLVTLILWGIVSNIAVLQAINNVSSFF